MTLLTWSSATVVGMIEINNDEKFRQIAGHFDHHADGAIQRRVHHPKEHISGFTQEASLDAATGTVPGPRAALPRRPPWTTIYCKTQNTNKVAIMPSSESLTRDAQLGEVYVDIFLAKQEVTFTISPWKAMLSKSALIPHVLYCYKKWKSLRPLLTNGFLDIMCG
jgi:hypothetical protein